VEACKAAFNQLLALDEIKMFLDIAERLVRSFLILYYSTGSPLETMQ
jgi:hypothetical protein